MMRLYSPSPYSPSPHSPSPRPLAVPGIGFPQYASPGSNVLDLAAFRRGRGAGLTSGHKRRSDVVRTGDRGHLPPQLIAGVAVALITMAAIVGPLVAWLLSRAAVLAS